MTAEEGAAYGAAILAGVGGGLWPTVDAACEVLVHTNHVTCPDANVVARMHDRYEEYRRIYPALRHIHHPRIEANV
jgi:xylulokinase